MINSLGNNSPRNGLVGEWLLDGNANDTNDGTKNNGTATNVTWGTDGVRGYQKGYGVFNGTTGYISIPISLSTADKTITFWSYQPGPASSKIMFDSLSGRFVIANRLNAWQIYDNSATYKTFSSAPKNNIWEMVTIALVGSTALLYIDGVYNSTVAYTPTPLGGSTRIGNWENGTGGGFGGNMSHFRIYNRVLNIQEIQTLYLEGLKKLGPANIASYPNLLSGLTYYADFKGTAHNLVDGVAGTVSGATLTTDRFGYSNNAYSYDGSNDYIEYADATNFSFTNKIVSFEGWFQTSSATSRQFIISKGTASNYEWGLEVASGLVACALWQSSGAIIFAATTTGTYNDGNWHHVMVTFNNTVPVIYIDGVSVAVTTTNTGGTNTNGTATVRVGYRNDNVGPWNGKIGEVRIYSIVKSADEVKMLYTLTNKDYIYPTKSYDIASLRDGLLLDLNEQGKDLSGNGNNGTLVNTPTVIRQGKAKGLTYNGTNQGVNFGNKSLITSAYTLRTIIKPNLPSASTFDFLFSKWGVEGSTTGFYTGIYNNAGTYRITATHFAGGTFTEINWNYAFLTTKYYDVVITWDGSNSKAYVDGILISSQANTRGITNSTHNLTLGISGDLSSHAFGGNIFSPRILNRALTATEIQQAYYSQKGNFIF